MLNGGCSLFLCKSEILNMIICKNCPHFLKKSRIGDLTQTARCLFVIPEDSWNHLVFCSLDYKIHNIIIFHNAIHIIVYSHSVFFPSLSHIKLVPLYCLYMCIFLFHLLSSLVCPLNTTSILI